MSDGKKVVSLSRARKTRDRAAAKAEADANAAKFGRTKAERVLEAMKAARASAKLDAHRLDGDD